MKSILIEVLRTKFIRKRHRKDGLLGKKAGVFFLADRKVIKSNFKF
jgi:hypothetical protein